MGTKILECSLVKLDSSSGEMLQVIQTNKGSMLNRSFGYVMVRYDEEEERFYIYDRDDRKTFLILNQSYPKVNPDQDW